MSNVPVVRFSEFDDDWVDKKLGDVTKRVKGNDGRMELPTLTISASQGWMDQIDRFSSNIAGNEQKNYTLLKKNDLSYNHGNSKIAKYGVVFSLDSYEEALVPRVYHSFRTTNDSFSLFIEYLFLTKKPDRELRKLVSSGARMDGLLNINYESFMGINMMFPSLPEQTKIGDFFKLLDDTIALHQKELDALKQAKQGFLQKMFPADGEKVPKIRFPEFSDDWVETKLGEVSNHRNGKPIEKYFDVNGTHRVISIGSYGKENRYVDQNIKVNYKEEFKDQLVKSQELTMVLNDKTKEGNIIGRTLLIEEDDLFIVNQRTEIISLYNILDSYFMFIYLNYIFRNKVRIMAQGGTQIYVNYNSVKEKYVSYPSKSEQIKIGDFFRQLDKSIELEEQKLENLKNAKKSFLQKMFI
ncbi:restriction endonuclease subunit S [Companilactobacillus metriopterae]|uniref:restriction endonuclease subunit S n=1 Tax=Companilactobacillus metriopterae TaxID=1909267 RepID=UPI00100AFCDC|nr:restriction endonuclease subunit S [Companilactobacillus metriopterae]